MMMHLIGFYIVTMLLTIFTRADVALEPIVRADDSAINRRDKSSLALTPQKQWSAAENDISTLQKIRRAIVRTEGFSVYAKNIKIISVNGLITLRGPVRTLEEKTKIEHIASAIIGNPDQVINNVEVMAR